MQLAAGVRLREPGSPIALFSIATWVCRSAVLPGSSVPGHVPRVVDLVVVASADILKCCWLSTAGSPPPPRRPESLTHHGRIRALELPRGNENLTWGFPNVPVLPPVEEVPLRQFAHVVADTLYGTPPDSELSTGYVNPAGNSMGFGPGADGVQVAVDPTPTGPGGPLTPPSDSEVDSASLPSDMTPPDSEIVEVPYRPPPSAREMIGALRRLSSNRISFRAFICRVGEAAIQGFIEHPNFRFTRPRQHDRRRDGAPPDLRDARGRFARQGR